MSKVPGVAFRFLGDATTRMLSLISAAPMLEPRRPGMPCKRRLHALSASELTRTVFDMIDEHAAQCETLDAPRFRHHDWVMLMDHEYSSMNDRCHDLGVWFGEMFFAQAQELDLIKECFGRVSRGLVARAAVRKALAGVTWAL